MSTSQIRRLLTNTLINGLMVDKDGTLETEYPIDINGAVNDQVGIQDHIVVHIIPADTESDTLSGDHKLFTGIFQMMVKTNISTQESLLNAEVIADKLQNIFPINSRITDEYSDGIVVQVITPLRVAEGVQLKGDIWWQVSCRFVYRCDTN